MTAAATCSGPHRPVVITRPQPEAAQWAQRLHALGHRAVALPLLDIRPSTSARAQAVLQAALHRLDGYRALMFVSPNAARFFWQHPAVQAHPMAARLLGAPQHSPYSAHSAQAQSTQAPPPHDLPRCWAPGPGTAAALRALGVQPSRIDTPAPDSPQWDSEHLWAQVAPQIRAGDTVLIVRGSDAPALRPAPTASAAADAADVADAPDSGQGRAWLAEHLRARGAQVIFAPVYERHPSRLDDKGQTSATVRARITALLEQRALWLLSSSELVQQLSLALCPSADAQGAAALSRLLAAHTALCTHPRIAAHARAAGWGRVLETAPSVGAVDTALRALANETPVNAQP